MRITYYGHACCALTSASGASLLIDPYEPGGFSGVMRYREIRRNFIAGVATHDHLDHHGFEFVTPVPPIVIDGEVGPFVIRRLTLDHDEFGGRTRGGRSDALMIEVDEWVIVHLGDVGQSPPDLPITSCDVALVPIGGNFTIGAFQAWEWICRLGPRCAVPVHYATRDCDLPIRGLETFLALAREYKWLPESYIDVEVDTDLPRVAVLNVDSEDKSDALAP